MSANKTLLAPGRFVVMLQGRHAGKKALVLTAYPEGTESRKYPYAIVLGIEKYPKKINREMPQETIVKRTQVKLFIKAVNFNHLLLTRHVMKEEDIWTKVKVEQVVEALADQGKKKELLNEITKVFRQKYLNNKMNWFFKPLTF